MRKKIAKSKKIKLSLLISVTAFLIALLLISWFSIRLINSARNQVISSLEIEMANLERSFTDKIDHTFSIIQNINAQIEEDPTNKNHINEILKRYRISPSLSNSFSWTAFSWSDEDYQIIVDNKNGIVKEPLDLSLRSHVPMTEKEPNKFHLGTPIIGSTSGKWVIPGGVGLVDKNGKYLGATTTGFEIEILAKLLHNVVQNQNVRFSLFGQNGIPILYGDIKSFGIDKSTDDDTTNDLAISKVLDEINSAKSDKVSSISLIKNRHAFLAKKINNYPYILFLQFDPKGINNKLLDLLFTRSIELLSVLFSFIILLFLVYREKQQGQKIVNLKQAADQAHEAKVEFLTQSVNEFKNFIYGIQGSAEIIKSDLKELISNLKKGKISSHGSEIHELETDFDLSCNIIEASHELTDFVNDLIYLNEAETGEFKINKSKRAVNISKIIKQALKVLKKRAKNYNIILISKIDDDLNLLPNLDPQRLKQIMVNLISNAIKRSQKDGVIEVIARNIEPEEAKKFDKLAKSTKEKFVEIIIKDHGSGMSIGEIKSALQKYQAIANVGKHKIDSLGLGLPIVKYLVEKQDGIFEIKSEKNKGSEIKIIF